MGVLGFYKTTPCFIVEMAKLPIVLYLCQILCVYLSFLIFFLGKYFKIYKM